MTVLPAAGAAGSAVGAVASDACAPEFAVGAAEPVAIAAESVADAPESAADAPEPAAGVVDKAADPEVPDTEAPGTAPIRGYRWRIRFDTPPGERHLLAVIVLIASAAFVLSARLRLLGGWPTGDEPAYLVLSKTLAKYHSLDVMRAYANQDYWSFYPYHLEPHVVLGAHGNPEPLHQIGGPVLWLVPFMLWGRAGAVLFMAAVSVLTLVNLYYFLRERGIKPPYAAAVTLAMAVGSPIYVLSAMSFVEPLGTLAILFAVRALLVPRLSAARLVVASTGVALAPWVHMRFAPTSVVLAGLLLARVWREREARAWRRYAQCLVPVVLSAVLIEVYTEVLYGRLNPMAPESIFGVSVFDVPFSHGLAGTLYDRNYGLIDNFPLFLLVLPGILLALRREYRRVNLVVLAVAVPYLVLSCTSTTWWGSYSPPARYVSILVPLFAFYIAVVLQWVNRWYATGVVALLALAGYAVAVDGDVHPYDRFTWWYDKHNFGMQRFGRLIGYDVERLVPSSFAPDQGRLFLIWILATLAVGLLFWLACTLPTALAELRRPPAGPASGDAAS